MSILPTSSGHGSSVDQVSKPPAKQRPLRPQPKTPIPQDTVSIHGTANNVDRNNANSQTYSNSKPPTP